ncbi:hypothetical protein [Terrabacter terrigena]|uniref:Uncharacterized protein n=1 Tax=Terrabacter terrigena TaxID=574718 RepID=A0ABW3N3M9_9MICO
MGQKYTDPDGLLRRAIEKVTRADDHLKGSRPGKWMLVLESEMDDRKTISVFKSAQQKPWDSLGLLRFATLQEELRAYGPGEAEDD